MYVTLLCPFVELAVFVDLYFGISFGRVCAFRKEGLPWLYYLDDTSLRSVELQTMVSLGHVASSLANSVSTLQFKLATYQLDGTFVGLFDLTDQLQVVYVVWSRAEY